MVNAGLGYKSVAALDVISLPPHSISPKNLAPSLTLSLTLPAPTHTFSSRLRPWPLSSNSNKPSSSRPTPSSSKRTTSSSSLTAPPLALALVTETATTRLAARTTTVTRSRLVSTRHTQAPLRCAMGHARSQPVRKEQGGGTASTAAQLFWAQITPLASARGFWGDSTETRPTHFCAIAQKPEERG